MAAQQLKEMQCTNITKEKTAKIASTTTNAHTLKVDDLGDHFETHLTNGLTSEQAANRLYSKQCCCVSRQKLNQINPKYMQSYYTKYRSRWVVLLSSIFVSNVFNKLLWFCSVLCFTISIFDKNNKYNTLYLGIVLSIIVTLTGLFVYYQESQTNEFRDEMAGVSNLIMPDVDVIRDGKVCAINQTLLVVGDIVILKAGMQVPADIRIIECTEDLQVKNLYQHF